MSFFPGAWALIRLKSQKKPDKAWYTNDGRLIKSEARMKPAEKVVVYEKPT